MSVWIAVIVSLATFITTAIVATFTYNQYLIARNKFRLDLFEKRYEIYSQTMNVMMIIGYDPRISEDSLRNFRELVRKSKFLFGKDLSELLDMVRDEMQRTFNRQTELEKEKIADKSKANYKLSPNEDWYFFYYEQIDDMFYRYMNIDENYIHIFALIKHCCKKATSRLHRQNEQEDI